MLNFLPQLNYGTILALVVVVFDVAAAVCFVVVAGFVAVAGCVGFATDFIIIVVALA